MIPKKQYEMGMVGLGVMGHNLLLNMADHGYEVIGYDKDHQKVDTLRKEAKSLAVHYTTDIKELISSVRKPCAIMLLVPAGAAVDSVIQDLLPHLQRGDLIIDAGNSNFKDTDNRTYYLAEKGIQFLGVGISGGEEGARLGPSIMPGGTKEAYSRVRSVFEAIAAEVNHEPCVTYLGVGSAGHYVKMVHNGIEYGLMQLIAESYDLLKRGLQLNHDQCRSVYIDWNRGELNSYLIEITSHILKQKDAMTGKYLLDTIKDIAKQNGTGMWTSQSAMELQIPTPTINVSVTMRDLSTFAKEREELSLMYPRLIPFLLESPATFINDLRQSLFAAMLTVYVQGFALLSAASNRYHYLLDLEAVSRIWRGGCIIRSALLEDICVAFKNNKNLDILLLDASLASKIMEHQESLRKVVTYSAQAGIPTPALMASLSYFDAYRSQWLPANLIQAQRDYFGAHTYERLDKIGMFHTEWERNEK